MLDTRLKTLLYVAQTKNFTHAAELLHLTQPAISNHIKQLAIDYDIKIFDKCGKSLQLTKSGELIVQYARELDKMENCLVSDIQKLKKDPKHFSIGVTSTLAEYLLPKIMMIYCKRHPNVTLDVTCSDRKTLFNKLNDYVLDWVLVNQHESNDGYSSTSLCKDESFIMVSSEHKLAREKTVDFEKLQNEKIILCYKNSEAMEMFEDELTKNSLSINYLNVILETNNIKIIKEFVQANMGVAFIQKVTCLQEIKEGKLVALSVRNANISCHIRISYR